MQQSYQKINDNSQRKIIEIQCTSILNNLAKNNSKKVYHIFKESTYEKKGKTMFIHDTNGKCLTENEDIIKIWTVRN